MTPLEYELLYEKIVDFGNRVYLIQDKVGDGDNDEIQKLKLDILNLRDQLRNASHKE